MNTKTYKRRKLPGLKSSDPIWHDLTAGAHIPLSEILWMASFTDRIHLCGSLEQVTREYLHEPLARGWEFEKEFVFKNRTATYVKPENPDQVISVRLISHRESWLPGCEDAKTACDAWGALKAEWKSTGLPLLSSPAATGKALLWEKLPLDKNDNPVEFPALSDELAKLIRSISPQHRIELLATPESVAHLALAQDGEKSIGVPIVQYDGRWMYAAMCGLDRFPVGMPRRVGYFKPYEPGWHHVSLRIPDTWNHVGLIPVREGATGWWYPHEGGYTFRTWACEPELTLALEGVRKLGFHPWEIVEHYDGWAFDKGRPLALWSSKLIEMRERLQILERGQDQDGFGDLAAKYRFAAAAIRQILNSTIGALHKNEFERETFVSDDNFRQWRRDHPDLAEGEHRAPHRVEGGYMVPTFVPDTSRLSIFMPHWSSTFYSLARARVVEWALRCDPATLIKINGDAIYSTVEQPELDKLDTQRLGQPRRK